MIPADAREKTVHIDLPVHFCCLPEIAKCHMQVFLHCNYKIRFIHKLDLHIFHSCKLCLSENHKIRMV